MADDGGSGSVPRDNVLHVMRHSSASMKVEGDRLTLVQDGIPEVYALPDQVTRRMLARLAGKYGVRMEWFYHPEMCCDGSGTAQ